ncbi:MAG: hypothetical protein KME27_26855 [Lyngbya sp. HA4199-MV5]|jgi:Zn-dependent M16 (insulinase) family peptidase|nr:hypothetical protein [Lyngbya sp. HA4199-MV5]
MDESHRDHFSSLSLERLLEELENLIVLEFQRSGKPWVSVVILTELFYEKYGASPEAALKAQSCSDSLRNLLKKVGVFQSTLLNYLKSFMLLL